MSSRKLYVVALLVFVAGFPGAGPLLADGPQSGFVVTPSLTIPLGEDATFFGAGGLAELSLYGRPAFAPALVPSVRAGYGYSQLQFDSSLSVVSVGAGLGLVLASGESAELETSASGGYYYGFLNTDQSMSAGGAYADATLAGSVFLSPAVSLSFSGGYRNLTGLGQFVTVGLGGRIRLDDPRQDTVPAVQPPIPQPLGAPQVRTSPTRPLAEGADAQPLRISRAEFEEVFPVFFKYYDEHPLGTFQVTNATGDRIEELSVTFRVGRYMDGATPCRAPQQLDGSRSATVEIMGFFNESVLDITEATKVNAEISVSFVHDDQEYPQTYTQTYTQSIRLHDRNSMTWDDDRKPAAYVTARDPSVMTLGKMISGITSGGPPSPIPVALRTAMALHATVGLYGMTYTPDPASPIRSRSAETMAIDYLQFPRQTLEYRGGDCDDISILYAALFESIGIPTAFVLVPGHIFLAFDLGITPEEARRQLPRAEELIFRDETAWVPLETTALADGFLSAWQTGAREWREAQAREQAELVRTADGWETYEPVGLLGQGQPLTLPAAEAVYALYQKELTSFVDQTIFPMVVEIEERARSAADPLPYRNRLAVLYGKYGLYDRSRDELERILREDPEYVPALVNMANLHVINDEPSRALPLFEQALAKEPLNPRVLLSIAQINHAMENYGIAIRMLDQAKRIDPVLAARFSYIELRGADSTRAGDPATLGEEILWEEADE